MENSAKPVKTTIDANIFAGRKYIKTVGRRKKANAQAKLFAGGDGQIIVNRVAADTYFPIAEYRQCLLAPLKLCSLAKDFDVSILTTGGGKHSQAEAARLAISRAILKHDETFRTVLRTQGFLTRDDRRRERKKPGKKRARRSPQWSKR